MPKRIRSPEYLEKQRKYKSEKYRARRDAAISYLGGCCISCGYGQRVDLHFDHINPLTKKFPISRATNDRVFWEAIQDCQLLCKDCHRIKSNKENSGENCHKAKLSNEEVKKILVKLKQGVPQIQLAREFNVGAMQISRIKNGTRWRYMTDET